MSNNNPFSDLLPTVPTVPTCPQQPGTGQKPHEQRLVPGVPNVPTKNNDERKRAGELDTILADACREHGLDPAATKQELVEAGDWPDLTPAALRTYVDAIVRSRLPGTRAELLDLIHRWADCARLDATLRQEFIETAETMPPAFIGENCQHFRRRLAKAGKE